MLKKQAYLHLKNEPQKGIRKNIPTAKVNNTKEHHINKNPTKYYQYEIYSNIIDFPRARFCKILLRYHLLPLNLLFIGLLLLILTYTHSTVYNIHPSPSNYEYTSYSLPVNSHFREEQNSLNSRLPNGQEQQFATPSNNYTMNNNSFTNVNITVS